MSEWEDFCESNGIANDEDAFDNLSDIYHESPGQRRLSRSIPSTNKMQFHSFQAAIAWAKMNTGKVIMRSPDENGFVEK